MGDMHTERLVVGSADCDALGHMTMARYFSACQTAGFAMQRAMGWPAGEVNKGRRLSFAVVHLESEFLAEVHAGQVILASVGLREIGNRSASFLHRIALEDGRPVFESTWKSALMNLDTRRAEAIPDDMRAAMQDYLVD